MSKRLIFSDLHLHPWAYGATITSDRFNSRLWAQREALREMVEYAVENEVKYAYFGGDLFHEHGKVPTQALMIASELFNTLRKHGIKVRAIHGNHDQYDRQGKIHSLAFLPEEEISGHWVDEGLEIHALPYTGDEEALKRFLGDVGDGNGGMMMLHQGVQGVPLASGFVPDEKLTAEMIPDNVQAFTGHYHFCKQVSQNLTIIGNLTPLNWGDIDQNKGFLVYDDELSSADLILQKSAPSFITWNESIAKHSDLSNVEGNFVRYTDPVEAAAHSEIREALMKEGALTVEFPEVKLEEGTDDLRTGDATTVQDVVKSFSDATDGRRKEVGTELREGNYETQ
jgi:DNA repair exonuclease SbcCD nuclease subunit